MTRLEYLPGYNELRKYYGECETEPGSGILSEEWVKENTIIVELPYPMKASWSGVIIKRIRVHKKIAAAVVDAETEIMNYKGYDWLKEQGYDIFDGCFFFRPKRNGKVLSIHSYAAAMDRNSHLAPYNRRGANNKWVNEQPGFIVEAYLKRGFFTFSWDGMHFQGVYDPKGMCDLEVVLEINKGWNSESVKNKSEQLKTA